jgi:histidinol dehydrogenase
VSGPFAFVGTLRELEAAPPSLRRGLVDRATPSDPDIVRATETIMARVRTGGDSALRALALELDGVALEAIEVSRRDAQDALAAITAPLRAAMERAAANIEAVHRAFRPLASAIEPEPGIRIERRPAPLDVVGVYAPGGRAAYPSSVLMGAIPARIAGVGTIVLCSPPERGAPRPVPSRPVLAAAALAGVDRIFSIGGAGAIAAMAFGTESVPAVQRIVGPGNAYVAEAKRQAAGVVSIDAPAGPSELLVIADASAAPDVIAREAVAQAEHDPRAAVVVVALDDASARAIARAIEQTVAAQPRAAIIAAALGARGMLLCAESLDDALDFAAAYAPEHLLLAVRDPERAALSVRNAGTVCLGETSSVAFGDYLTGANHVLPTGGHARSYSGLSTDAFVHWTTVQRVSRTAAASLSEHAAILACSEGLPAHAAAVSAWRVEVPA